MSKTGQVDKVSSNNAASFLFHVKNLQCVALLRNRGM